MCPVCAQVVTLAMSSWETGKKLTLTYWGQKVAVASPLAAELIDTSVDAHGNTIVQMTLGEQPTPTAAPSAAATTDLAMLLDKAVSAYQATYDVDFQLIPPARLLPHVVCHEPWPPPPAPPPPAPPPSPMPARPPPPPPQTVRGCESSVHAEAVMIAVMGELSIPPSPHSPRPRAAPVCKRLTLRLLCMAHLLLNAGATASRVNVLLELWIPAEVVLVSVSAAGGAGSVAGPRDAHFRVSVPRAMQRSVAQLGDGLSDPPATQFAFLLGESPPDETASFHINLDGDTSAELLEVTCRAATRAERDGHPSLVTSPPSPMPSPPPPPAPPPPGAPPPPPDYTLALGGGSLIALSAVSALALHFRRNRAPSSSRGKFTRVAMPSSPTGAAERGEWDDDDHDEDDELGGGHHLGGHLGGHDEDDELGGGAGNDDNDNDDHEDACAVEPIARTTKAAQSEEERAVLPAPDAESGTPPTAAVPGSADAPAGSEALPASGRASAPCLQHACAQHGALPASEPSARWRVSVELEGEAFQLSVAMSAASKPLELKQAIAEACLASLGSELTPALWLQGAFDTMAVQFLGQASGAAMTMKASTPFAELYASRTLRVTRRTHKGGAASAATGSAMDATDAASSVGV